MPEMAVKVAFHSVLVQVSLRLCMVTHWSVLEHAQSVVVFFSLSFSFLLQQLHVHQGHN